MAPHGTLAYISGDLFDSNKYFTEAVQVADKRTVHDSVGMASVLEHAALVARAVHDYPRAYSLYLRALNIRRQFLDDHHPDIAHSLMNLASLCRDRSTDRNDRWSVEAEALENQIDSLTHQTEYISSSRSNAKPRPVTPDLAVNQETATLPRMVAFAHPIIDKHRPVSSVGSGGFAALVGFTPSPEATDRPALCSHSFGRKCSL